MVREAVEDHTEHPGAHVLQRAEAVCKLLAVQHVGPGDDQCAAGDWGEDRARKPYNFVTSTPLTLRRSWVVTTSHRSSCGSQVLRPQRRWD